MTKTIASALALFILTVGQNASANTLFMRFEGTSSGSLNGVPFQSQAFEITASYDTNDIVLLPTANDISEVPLTDAQFEISGVGAGTFELATALFVNRTNSAAGFTRLVGIDLLNVESPLFVDYDLLQPFGPIFDATPTAVFQFVGIPTSSGFLTFNSASDVTFQTVPEPCTAVLLAVGIAAFSLCRRRKVSP
jgi:hypothetical protein